MVLSAMGNEGHVQVAFVAAMSIRRAGPGRTLRTSGSRMGLAPGTRAVTLMRTSRSGHAQRMVLRSSLFLMTGTPALSRCLIRG